MRKVSLLSLFLLLELIRNNNTCNNFEKLPSTERFFIKSSSPLTAAITGNQCSRAALNWENGTCFYLWFLYPVYINVQPVEVNSFSRCLLVPVAMILLQSLEIQAFTDFSDRYAIYKIFTLLFVWDDVLTTERFGWCSVYCKAVWNNSRSPTKESYFNLCVLSACLGFRAIYLIRGKKRKNTSTFWHLLKIFTCHSDIGI